MGKAPVRSVNQLCCGWMVVMLRVTGSSVVVWMVEEGRKFDDC